MTPFLVYICSDCFHAIDFWFYVFVFSEPRLFIQARLSIFATNIRSYNLHHFDVGCHECTCFLIDIKNRSETLGRFLFYLRQMTPKKFLSIVSASVIVVLSITVVILGLVIQNRNSEIDNLKLDKEKQEIQAQIEQQMVSKELEVMKARRLLRDSLTQVNSKHRYDENIALLDSADSRTIREITLRLISR